MSLVLGKKIVNNNAELISVYRENLGRLGFCSETLFYGSETPHRRKMSDVGSVVSQEVTQAEYNILDVGCGYGSLIDFLPPHLGYVGVDLVPEFVSEARRRYPGRTFVHGDVKDVESTQFDVVVLAGVLSSVPDPKQVLSDALQMAQNQVVFDVTITSRVRKGFEGLNLWSTSEAKKMAENVGLSAVKVHDEGNVWVILSGRLS